MNNLLSYYGISLRKISLQTFFLFWWYNFSLENLITLKLSSAMWFAYCLVNLFSIYKELIFAQCVLEGVNCNDGEEWGER